MTGFSLPLARQRTHTRLALMLCAGAAHNRIPQ